MQQRTIQKNNVYSNGDRAEGNELNGRDIAVNHAQEQYYCHNHTLVATIIKHLRRAMFSALSTMCIKTGFLSGIQRLI